MYEPDEPDWYMYQVAMQRGLTVVVVIVTKVGVKLLSPRPTTSTRVVVAVLTAETGPHTGSYSGLYIPDFWGRQSLDEMNDLLSGWQHAGLAGSK